MNAAAYRTPLDVRGLRSWFKAAMARRRGAPALDYALTAEAADAMHAYVLQRKPANVLELGSGFSTFVLARACALAGSKLWTADHDEKWLADVRSLMRQYQTEQCPFGEVTETTIQEWRWYHGRHPLANIPAPALILVDHGPTMGARLRDLPALARMLAPGGALLLDDCREKTNYERSAASVLRTSGFGLRRLEGSRSPGGRWLGLSERTRASR